MKIDFSQVVTAEQKKAEAEAALVVAMQNAIDAYVENTAKARGYNSAAHAATYISSTIPEWAKEAQAFVAWRDSVWMQVFRLFGEVEAGNRRPPTSAEEILVTLPQINWN